MDDDGQVGDLRVGDCRRFTHWLIGRTGGRYDLYDDVLQEVLLGAWLAIESHQPERGELREWQLSKAAWAGKEALRQMTAHGRFANRQDETKHVSIEGLTGGLEWLLGVGDPGYSEVECELLKESIQREIEVIFMPGCRAARMARAVFVDGERASAVAQEFDVTQGRVSQIVRVVRDRLRRRDLQELLAA